MTHLDPALLAWLPTRHHAVLITLRSDGSPQSSNVVFAWWDGAARVSVTADRAKTANLRRDNRGQLHVLGDSFWTYAAIGVCASLSETSMSPGDAVGRDLLRLYEDVAGSHDDPEGFFASMVKERRLILTLTPTSAVSMGVE